MGPGADSMSLNNSFNLYTIPKLTANGSNWVTYKTRIVTMIGAKGLMRHLRGTAKEPKEPLTSIDKDQKEVDPTTEQLDDYEDKWDQWLQKEYTVKQQIFSTISESLLLHMQDLDRVHKVWSAVCNEYEGKTEMVKIDLWRRLQEMHCHAGGDVHEHFDALLRMKEELAGMRAKLDDTDFAAIILSSLPADYDPILSAMLSAARITGKTIPPLTIISHVNEEFDRRVIKVRLEKADTALLASFDPIH